MSKPIDEKKLRSIFEEQADRSKRHYCPAAVIEYQGERGIAFRLGENFVTDTWLSGDILVHWSGGGHTVLPDEFTLVSSNPFDITPAP